MGWDLNRYWGDANEWGHPTIYAAKHLIVHLDQVKVNNTLFYIIVLPEV